MIESLKTQIKMLKMAFKTSMKGARKSKKEKEIGPDGNPIEKVKRPLNAWQAWTHHVLTEYKEEYDAFSAEQESRRGVAIKFAKHCQETKTEEFEEFKSSFVPSAPVEKKATSEKKVKKTKKPAKAESESESESEEPVKAKAKVAKTKTKKPAKAESESDVPKSKPVKSEKKAVGGAGSGPSIHSAAHVVEMAHSDSDSDSDDDELTVKKWIFRGKTYFRSGENDCWIANSDGSMGSWAGKYDPIADSIDITADEPEHE